MSQTWKPPPTAPTGPVDPHGAPWPGLIPLRPLGVADIFGAALRLVRTHAALLCLTALGGTLIGAAAVFGVLATQPDGATAAGDQWLRRLQAGSYTPPPWSFLSTLLIGALTSYVTTMTVSGLAAALVGDASIGRPTGTRAALARMRGRWAALAGVSVVVSMLMLIGFFALLVPGLLVIATLILAAPAVVLEKAGTATALRRSVRLTRGVRGRVLGITVLANLLASVITAAVLSLLPASATLAALALQALLAAVTVPWTASVIALLYVDSRMRNEGLARDLVRSSLR